MAEHRFESTSKSISGNIDYTLRMDVTSTYNTNTNKTSLTVKLILLCNSDVASAYVFNSQPVEISCEVQDSDRTKLLISSDTYETISCKDNNAENELGTWTREIEHDRDGKLLLYLFSRIGFDNAEESPELLPDGISIRVAELDLSQNRDIGMCRIHNGTSYDSYAVQINNGEGFAQYTPYVYDGTEWKQCN